jgi:predicted RNA-binding Zn-ribbon protein involved in translation (DUF1610 family)
MALACPICKSPAQEIARTAEATGFHCPTHGDFKVADTVFAEDGADDYTREEWEAALDKAKQRAEPDEWPLIIVDDFY